MQWPNIVVRKTISALQLGDSHPIQFHSIPIPMGHSFHSFPPFPIHAIQFMPFNANDPGLVPTSLDSTPQVTAQCRESQVGEFKPLLLSVLQSFQPPASQVL